MKTIYFIILLLVISFCSAISQNEGNKPINSGFVFIDGKYIDAPYKVKAKGMAFYINNIQVERVKFKKEKNPYTYKHRLGVPPCLNRNSSLDDIKKCKEPLENLPYDEAMKQYFFRNYVYDVARDSIIEYIRTFPNIKSLQIDSIGGWCWIIESYSGEISSLWFLDYNPSTSKKWGPGGTGPTSSKKDIKNRLKLSEEDVRNTLENNGTYFFFSNDEPKEYYSTNYLFKIINSNLSNEQKKDSLKLEYYNEYLINKFIENYEVTPQFKKRIKEACFDTVKKKIGKSKETGYLQNNKSIKSSTCFSPDKKEIYGWCSNMWEEGIFLSEELDWVRDYIIKQDFTYDMNNIFYDNTPNDTVFGNCSYSNLVSMRNAGLLYFSWHGIASQLQPGLFGLILAYSTTQSSLAQGCSNDANIEIKKVPSDQVSKYGWDSSLDLWIAIANPQWFINNWKFYLTQSNAIVIISACFCGKTGTIESFGGGVTFGYTEETDWGGGMSEPGIRYNNKQLLKRMNGETDNNSSGSNRRL